MGPGTPELNTLHMCMCLLKNLRAEKVRDSNTPGAFIRMVNGLDQFFTQEGIGESTIYSYTSNSEQSRSMY